ncbi:hypothetical protein V5F29_21140 [Xanthobacter aminoxidans]|uniref:hypothetical protein n=1 Tax=Xanthobacter aminoxidans TaxID=186280 RepID=UPI003729A4AF
MQNNLPNFHRARQTVVNLGSNFLVLLLNVGVGILLVPFVIRHAGLEAYSFYPLAINFSQGVILVITAITGTFARFLSVALHGNDPAVARRIFSTANLALLVLNLALVPVILAFSYNVGDLLHVPPELTGEVGLLMAFTLLSTLCTITEGGISTVAFSLNRIELKNVSQIASKLILLGGVVALFLLFGGNLVFIGIAMFAGAVVSLLISVVFWRHIAPGFVISLREFDRTFLRQVGASSFWVFVNQIGALIFLQMDLLFLNLYWGSLVGGAYGAVMQAAIAVRTLFVTVVYVYIPKATFLFASEGPKAVASYILAIERAIAILSGLVIGILVGFGPDLLRLWLGPAFVDYTIPYAVMLIALAPTLVAIPVNSAFAIFNAVRLPAVVTFWTGLLYLALLFGMRFLETKSPLLVPIAGGLILAVKNGLFTPAYFARVAGMPARVFFIPYLHFVLVAAVAGVVGWWVREVLPAPSLIILPLEMGVATVVTAGFVCAALLNADERGLLARIARRLRRR